MRIAIVADIHSNVVAFEAVLADLRSNGGFDRIWSLGDMIGYGPRPNETLDLLRSLDHVAVAGNHDLGAIGRTPLSYFNREAALACRWSGEQLTPDNREYLEGLKQIETCGDFTLVHASLRDPTWEYLVHEEAAKASFKRLTTRYLLVGHSHMPLYFQEHIKDGARSDPLDEGEPLLLGTTRFIFNPGGVGQPRDGDPRAAYGLYDTEAEVIRYRRVAYKVGAVQEDILQRGLPPRMAERLALGW